MSAVLPAVPLDRLHANPANVRDDLGNLDELGASIRAVGLLQPLVISEWPKVYTVIDGHRRLAAARAAGARALPCLLTNHDAADQQLAVMLAAALHKQLEPLEQGRAYARLQAGGMSIGEISRRTGHGIGTVHSRLQLVKLPPEAQDLVASGAMSITVAGELARDAGAGRPATVTASSRAGWFNKDHLLHEAASGGCRQAGHPHARRIVGGACGQCWEAAIRADERRRDASGVS